MDQIALVLGWGLVATLVAIFVSSAWAGRKAREGVEGFAHNALARQDRVAEARGRRLARTEVQTKHEQAADRAADALAAGTPVSRPREERNDFFRMKAGDTVTWRTVPWFHGVALVDLFFGAARGSLDAVVVGTIIANNVTIVTGLPSMAGRYRLASWFLPGHPARPLLQTGLLGPADQVTVELVALDDVDLVVYALWERAPVPAPAVEPAAAQEPA